MPEEYHQIRIIQEGADVFVFDTIKWPEKIFPYPIISMAGAFKEASYEAKIIGWHYMSREQFEWVLHHHECMISHVTAYTNHKALFYCNNHKCWEKAGRDFISNDTESEEAIQIPPDFINSEERLI